MLAAWTGHGRGLPGDEHTDVGTNAPTGGKSSAERADAENLWNCPTDATRRSRGAVFCSKTSLTGRGSLSERTQEFLEMFDSPLLSIK
jgi:hypothetical protein